MNLYKKLMPSKEMRMRLLQVLHVLPDPALISLQYFIKYGRFPNLRDPKRYSEKIQWYKLNYHDPLMQTCVDKYLVRDYVAGKGLDELLIPLYGHWETASDVDFDSLPDRFVIKTTHGSGNNSVYLCKDKNKIDLEELRQKLDEWNHVEKDPTGGCEWAYYGIKPGILAEEYLTDPTKNNDCMSDYKFVCFNGEPRFINVHTDRSGDHRGDYYDVSWRNLHVTTAGYRNSEQDLPRPPMLDKMLEAAKILSADFPFVRVDLYAADDRVYFGELTFYHASGYLYLDPDEADFTFGEMFILPEKKK